MPADGMIAAHLSLEDSRHVRWLATQHAAYSILPSVEKALARTRVARASRRGARVGPNCKARQRHSARQKAVKLRASKSGLPPKADMEQTCRHVADGPILLQKSPQTFCEIRIGNNLTRESV